MKNPDQDEGGGLVPHTDMKHLAAMYQAYAPDAYAFEVVHLLAKVLSTLPAPLKHCLRANQSTCPCSIARRCSSPA